jgi:hypothetical protein
MSGRPITGAETLRAPTEREAKSVIQRTLWDAGSGALSCRSSAVYSVPSPCTLALRMAARRGAVGNAGAVIDREIGDAQCAL